MPEAYVDTAAWRERQRLLAEAAPETPSGSFEEWVRAHQRRGTRGVRAFVRRRARRDELDRQYRLAEDDATFYARKGSTAVNDVDVAFYNEQEQRARQKAERLRRAMIRMED